MIMNEKSRGRLMRALAFEEVEPIPVAGYYGKQFLEENAAPRDKVERLRKEMAINPPAVSIFVYESDLGKDGRDEWGVLWEESHDIDHPIKDWDDLMGYEFPDPVKLNLFPEEEISECRRKGEKAVFGSAWQLTTFERYRTLRGFENTLTDPILYPDHCFDLIKRIEEYNLRIIRKWIQLGCEIIGFADDWGAQRQMLMSPELWRTFYRPVYRRMCRLIHEGGAKTWMHSDGAIESIIPDLVEVGLDILDPVQADCIDIRGLSERFRNRLVIWGGLDSHLVARGTYEGAKRHVAGAIEVFKGFDGGMVGTTSNYLIPSVDVALALYHGFRNKM